MKILNTIYWALFNMSFAALYCFYYAIPLTILTISIITLSSIILAFIEYKSHLYYIDNIGYLHNKVKENNIPEVLNIIEYGANINAITKYGHIPLHFAHEENMIMTLINHGADVNAKEGMGRTPLTYMAARYDEPKNVIKLIEQGADINTTTQMGWTPLHWATKNGNIAVVKSLIEKGANVNAKNNDDETSLHLAIEEKNTDIALELIEKGAYLEDDTPILVSILKKNIDWLALKLIDKKIEKSTRYINKLMDLAAEYGNPEIALHLIKKGAKIDAVDIYHETNPLYLASKSGNTKTAMVLIDHGANVNYIFERGKITALHAAAKFGHTETAVALIERGAKVDTDDKYTYSPLHFAALYDHTETAMALIEKGANIYAVNIMFNESILGASANESYKEKKHNKTTRAILDKIHDINTKDDIGFTPIQSIIGYLKNVEILLELIKRGADINIKDPLGRTLLHLALTTEISIALINHGADINATDEYGYTPLNWAAKKSNNELVKFLVDNGANLNTTNNLGMTPLHEVASYINPFVSWNDSKLTIITLLNYGANINAKDNKGFTPLHLAVRNRDTKTAIALIEHGADINAKSESEITPLHCAVMDDQADINIIRILIENGANINTSSENVDTPLHCAAIKGKIKIVITLLEYGAEIVDIESDIVNVMTKNYIIIRAMERLDWWTDLHTSVIINNLNEIRTLEYTPSETSPLDLAIMIGNIDAVRALIERGIQYDKDKCLRTATYSNRHELAQLFLEKGANPLSKNQLGQTAFHFADARGNENIMKIFVDNIQNNSARSIQRGFRSYLFKNNKANSTQEPTPPHSLGGPTPK
jgi:ankyrin repeat protein